MDAMNDDVRAYLEALPEERRARVDALHDLVLRLFPDAVVDMSYKMPTYRVGDGWVAIANQKRYVSLYTCSAAHIAPFIVFMGFLILPELLEMACDRAGV